MIPWRLMLIASASTVLAGWLYATWGIWREAGRDPTIGPFGRVLITVFWPVVFTFVILNRGVERLVDLTEWFDARLKRRRAVRLEARRMDDLWRGRERR